MYLLLLIVGNVLIACTVVMDVFQLVQPKDVDNVFEQCSETSTNTEHIYVV